MHALFVDGVCNICLYLLLETCIVGGYGSVYESFSEYIANWKWPARVGYAHLSGIFEASRKDKHRKAKHIKCQASDMMSLAPVAALFAQNVLMKLNIDCKAACDAWIALVDVVDIIAISAKVTVPPTRLLTAIEHFLQLFVAAWGFDFMTPKFHWTLHFPDILQRIGYLLMCFCLERKHRVPKRYAEGLTNISRNSSASLLMEVTSHHFGQLSQADAFNFDIGIVCGRDPPKSMRKTLAKELNIDCTVQAVKYSTIMRFNAFATCSKGDVILFRGQHACIGAAIVHCHYEIEGVPVSLVSTHSLIKKDERSGYSVWGPTGISKLIEAHDILDTVIYSMLPNNRLGILLSAEFR